MIVSWVVMAVEAEYWLVNGSEQQENAVFELVDQDRNGLHGVTLV